MAAWVVLSEPSLSPDLPEGVGMIKSKSFAAGLLAVLLVLLLMVADRCAAQTSQASCKAM